MFSAALFIEQSSPTSAPKVLTDCLAYWKSDPAELVCEERRAWFRERVEQGSRTVAAQRGGRGRG